MKEIGMYRRVLLLIVGLLTVGCVGYAQQRQWVFFSDKGPSPVPVRLSEKAAVRHARLGVDGAYADMLVYADYVRQLEDAGLHVRCASRWLNAVSVETGLDARALKAICPAVCRVQPVANLGITGLDGNLNIDSLSYGNGTAQVQLLNLDCLHDKGYTGEGVLLCVFDAGFYRMDTLAAFDSLWQQGRVLTYHDFVNNDSTIFDEHSHGMFVSSTIVSNLPGQLVGAAPHVTLAMARTESVFSETHQEEDNWMMAMEWADSLGADVIHSSLGYTTFDAGQGDYTYADMNGDTSIIARAADMAAARGILVVTSAGNEGNSPWGRISTPCDGDSVLCVGSVDGQGNYSPFSGRGPSADGRVKPDVAAQGFAVAAIGNNGQVGVTTGTSFAAPQVAGLAACLLQAHPQRSNMDVVRAIQQSGNQYNTPDSLVGYGIPDACKADSLLWVQDTLGTGLVPAPALQAVDLFPNPAQQRLVLQCRDLSAGISSWTLHTADGRVLVSNEYRDVPTRRCGIDLHGLAPGVYFLRVGLADGHWQQTRFVKQ